MQSIVTTLVHLWNWRFAPGARHLGSAQWLIFFCLCQGTPIGAFEEPIHAVAQVICSMRDHGRRMSFIGLANTLLDDSHARVIARALRRLLPLSPGEEPETLEMHRMVFQELTRRELLNEARRAGVNVLLSDPNGPALR